MNIEIIKNILSVSNNKKNTILFFLKYNEQQKLKNTEYKVGIQNIHHEKSGAYTGEISAEMVKFLDVQYAIVGHSERRQYFFETDTQINEKIKSALNADLYPVVCVGSPFLNFFTIQNKWPGPKSLSSSSSLSIDQ